MNNEEDALIDVHSLTYCASRDADWFAALADTTQDIDDGVHKVL